MNNINGIIVLNKEQNWTSHDCVAVMRGLVSIKKIGHTGTLDPMATGVLPICIGQATRVMEYLELDTKKYRCTMTLGIDTDTQDIWGKVLEEQDYSHVSLNKVEEVLKSFVGIIDQIPPKYSALKVNGRKLYEYARAGEEVEIKSRKITIKNIELLSFNGTEISFDVECSKGTYIRTLCRDIAFKLGTVGTMSSLERTESGIFSINDSYKIEELKEMSRDEILRLLKPIDYPLVHFGKIELEHLAAKDFVNGKKMNIEKRKDEINLQLISSHNEMYNVYTDYGFLGVARLEDKILTADKVFDVRAQNESI